MKGQWLPGRELLRPPLPLNPMWAIIQRLDIAAAMRKLASSKLEMPTIGVFGGLTFDGSGTQTSRHAVLLYANSHDITGHQVVQNTFRRWGGTGENTKGAAAVILRPRFTSRFRVKNSVISDNTFTNVAHEAIRLTQTMNITIEHNAIQYMQCGRTLDGRAGATGIKDAQNSVGTIIRK